MGELCGPCNEQPTTSTPAEVEDCPGQWFIDMADGRESPVCGLLKGVVLFEYAPLPPGSNPRKARETVVHKIPNPFYKPN
jgi:hypothetical protein